MDRSWNALNEAQQRIILYGSGREKVPVYYEGPTGVWAGTRAYEGVIPALQRRYDETASDYIRMKIEEVMSQTPCFYLPGHAVARSRPGGDGGRQPYP